MYFTTKNFNKQHSNTLEANLILQDALLRQISLV